MIDSGSMACTLSEAAEASLLQHNPDLRRCPADDVVIIGCGGHQVTPKAIYDVDVVVYDCKMVVPMLVVPGQTDDMILGSNAIKKILELMRKTDSYWRLVSEPSGGSDEDCHRFFSLLSNTERWRGDTVPDKVGTLKLQQCVTLQPQSEHLVWGKLPASAPISVGSTVVVEPTQSRCRSSKVLVGRVVTPMWGDRWLPMKVMNPTSEPVVLKRNTKLADVFPCIAAEDLSQPDHIQAFPQSVTGAPVTRSKEDVRRALEELGLQDLDLDACEVSDLWRERLCQIIERYEAIFSQHKLDCGEASDFVHKIHLVDERPFRLPYRRVPPNHYEKLRTAINDMEEKGIIRKSNSEYASPLVLVWKKNGDLRICTDFRCLNAKTEYETPADIALEVIEVRKLPHHDKVVIPSGQTMDLTSGFYNVPLHEDHKKYTAFSSPFGLHEYNRMPQGLSNSPATFMRMMLSIFGDENFTSLLCYLDDLMVFAPTEQLALERLEMVFSRLKKHNLKLAPKKCYLLRKTVSFLGHVITGSGVQTDPGKVEAIGQVQVSDLMDSDGVTPSQKKIRSFLGMVLYYQHFIEDCSAKARPLFKLLSEQKAGGKAQRGWKSKKKCHSSVKLTPDDWTPECRVAFDTLKHDLLHTLAHPDFGKPFILAVDASFDGIGAMISQLQPGEKIARPVAFASKTLSHAQLDYPAHRLEFLALKWAICDKFSHWLKGVHFTAWSDNNPLIYILTKPRLDACEQRWVAKLAAYDFDLKYVPGPKDTIADALSREPFVRSCVSHRLVKEPYLSLLDEVNGVVTGTVQDAFRLTTNCQRLQTTDDQADEVLSHEQDPCLPSGGAMSAEEVSAVMDAHRTGDVSQLLCTSPELLQLPEEDPSIVIPHSQLHNVQQQDAVVSRVLFYVQRHRRPNARERAAESSCVLRLLKHWKKLKVRNGLLYRVKRDRRMDRKIYQFVTAEALKQQVLHGVHDAAGHQGRSRTLSLASERFFWTGMQRDVSAKQVARCLWDKFFCIYGFPKRIHSDQGANFESRLLKDLLEMAGVQKSHTTPYHPMGNGITERFNRTLGGMIRALPPKSKSRWPQMLQMLTFCYNATVHETTGFAPFYLMFGRVPRLPVDVMFHHVLEDTNVVSHHEFVHHLKRDLSEAAQVAQKNAIGEQDRHAKIYNRKVRGMPLAVGDRVLLANRGERGKRKVADRWDSTPFDVVSVRSTINVYRIKDAVTGKERVVHGNMLLPVDFLTFPDQDGDGDLTSLGESRSNASCVSAWTSVALDNQEDSQVRTMDWLMQSPVQAEAESKSVPEEDAVGKAVPVDTSEEDQSDELLDSVPDDSIPDHITDALPNTSLDTVHLPVDGGVALGDPPDLVESGQITVAPLAVAAFTEKMSCGYERMYNACLSVVLWRCPLLSIKHTSASPLRSAIPLLLVPSANFMECVSAWNLS
ncbi:hypothetical protein AAFF_G00192560 [Aldrovandia affinis]|uniref:Gypsy retrotransposon integrase-like protein 1 n=1 Tax=Aldrovandia affinis TaxID=143900 RepID=A0AAD7RJD3_9TELE|nr:hypothetical protein AAFF_G00192560 [Aldrovandia affinis]